jgi:hypothetical protein
MAFASAFVLTVVLQTAFDLVTLTPPLVFGPFIHEVRCSGARGLEIYNNRLLQVASPDALNTSVKYFWEYLTGEKSAEGAAAAYVSNTGKKGPPSLIRLQDRKHSRCQGPC